jgi:two-component system chemotaxis sensor kinase CheA
MSLRMVPIKPTFLKMQRIVRDTAQAVGKDVGIRLVGEDAELDKTVLERISDPLVHLVRNSVDHGIESAESRRARGKPERGMVTLVAAHHAGRFVLEVQDDGAGLDPDKLVKKAIEKKLVQPGAQLTEKEAIQLIFAPGFSTKELVTDVSGRGVGMDVVKTNIRELGGEIEIRSVKGEGTTFRIELPLTLAIVDAMVLACSKQRFVIPLSQIHETLQPKPEMAKTTAIGSILLLRGETLPMFFLGDFFNVPCKRDATQATALVIRAPQLSFALVVDEILGQQQVVVKQLNRDLNKRVSGVSGTTILGDGRPSLIIEAAELIKRNPTPRRSEERTAS